MSKVVFQLFPARSKNLYLVLAATNTKLQKGAYSGLSEQSKPFDLVILGHFYDSYVDAVGEMVLMQPGRVG